MIVLVASILLFCKGIFGQNPALPYALPIYTNSCATVAPSTNDIVNVFKTSINNYPAGKNIRNVNSGCGNSVTAPGGFYNYTLYQPIEGKVLVVRRGDQFKVTVGAGKTFGQHYKVWVDWNQNNTYNNVTTGANAELVYQTTGTSLVANSCVDTLVGGAVSQSGWITVPMTAACGQTRLRVRSVFSTPTFTAIDNQTYGEIEEYYVVVLNNPETPLPIVNFTDTSICVGKSITIKANSTGAGIISFFNKFNATSAMATNIPGGVSVGPDSVKFNVLNNDTMIFVQNTEAGCKSKRIAVSIATQSLPQLSILPHDTTICHSDTITLTGKLDTINLTNVYKKFGEVVPATFRKIIDDSGANGSHCGSRRERTIEVNNVRPTILSASSIAEVGVRINHKRIKDVYIELVAPNGSKVILSNANGSNTIIAAGGNYGSGTTAANFNYCKFSDTSAINITSVTTSQITGYKKPQQLMSNLTGSSTGYWTLVVKDINTPTAAGSDDDGLLYAWYIKFKRDNFADTTLVWSPLATLADYQPITTWSDNNKRFAFPTVTTNYFLEIANTNGCRAKDSTLVTIIPEMQLTAASSPNQICVGQQATLTASSFGGIDSTYWSPSFSAINDSINSVSPIVTTLYKVYAKSVYGCNDSATVNVIVNPIPAEPIITSTGSLNVCAGSNVVLQSNQTTGNNWSTGQNTQTATYTTTTSNITCTFTDINGCVSLPSIPTNVVVNPLPVTPLITPSSSTTFCIGNSIVLTAPSGFTYNWMHDGVAGFSTNQNVTVNAGSNYSVIITDANGCSASSINTNIVVNPLPATPTLTALGPTSFCPGGNVTLESSVGVSYTWIPNALNTQTNTVGAAGSYTVKVTDSNGCTSLASNAISVTLFSNPNTPVISASGPIQFCIGNNVTLTSPSATSYLWNPNGETTQSINVNTTGSYSVQVTGTNGCTSIFSSASNVVVNTLPAAPILIPLTPTNICQGTVAMIDAGNYASYQWSDGSILNPLSASSTGNYSVIITDANGCTSPSSPLLNITVNPLPQAPTLVAIGPTTFCNFDSVQLVATSTVTNPIYSWLPNSSFGNVNSVYAHTSGTYTVNVTDVNGCTSLPSNEIDVNATPIPPPPIITAIGSTVFCEGDSVELQIDSGANFQWNTGQTSQNITVNTSDTYSALVVDACAITHTPTIVIDVLKKPIADFDVDINIGCEPLEVSFSNKSLFSDTYTWNFETGSLFTETALIHEFENAGKYTVTLIANSANGCTDSKTLVDLISVGRKPEISYDYTPKPAYTSTPFIRFEAILNDANSILWSCPAYNFLDTLLQTKLNFPDTGTYKMQVTASNEFGCVVTEDFELLIEGDFQMYMPNAFTPSTKDDLNNFLKPVTNYLDNRNFHMMIYDRWGKKVFDTTNPETGWDGSVDGQAVTGFFNWIIECLDTRGVTHSKSGSVNVIR